MTKLGTLRHGRYSLTLCDELDHDGRPQYLIEGKRGAVYGLLRNQNPSHLFVTSLHGAIRTPFDGVWFEETETEIVSTDGDVIAR